MGSYTLRDWIRLFDADAFTRYDSKSQCDAGWYDWFCRTSSLRNKLYKLAPKVKQIAKSDKVDIDTMYVFFKNNCPLYGNLYDDFRICDIETGDVVYTIVPRCGHKNTPNGKKSIVWGSDNGFVNPLVEGTWKDVRKFFGV